MEYQVKFPGWMRQSDFGPCDGEMCYFFLNKLTNGIGNKEKKRQVVEYSRGTGVNTTGCTNECVIIFGKRSSYCRMCYRNQPGKSEIKWEEEELQISDMGRSICEEPICDVFWDKGYDKIINNDTA